MSPKRQIVLLLSCLGISLIAVLSYDLIPLKRYSVLQDDAFLSLYSDESDTSVAQWVNKEQNHFTCTYIDKPSKLKYCGLDIQFGNGREYGVDLSGYESIELHIRYRGGAQLVRVFMRNYSESYSNIADSTNSTKYLSMLLPVHELREEIDINLREFTVPEWWMRTHGLSRSLVHPEFSNIVHLGVDVPYPAPFGVHEFELADLYLVRPFITRENFYLSLLALWFSGLLTFGLFRFWQVWHAYEQRSQQLQVEKDRGVELREQSEKYKTLSTIDELTRVLNRRGIQAVIDELIESNSLANAALILIDIDWFKNINDSFGHDFGDSVLIGVCDALITNVRESDQVCRWGGEEFLLVCPNTSEAEAVALANKLRYVFAQVKIGSDFNGLTASFGVSTVGDRSWKLAIRQADSAVYTAKADGRDCVRVFNARASDDSSKL